MTLSIFFNSCTKLVQDNFPEVEPKPVLNGILIPNNPVRVHVSLFTDLNDTKIKVIDNAVVSIYIDNEFKGCLNYEGDGFYSSNIMVESLKEYKCIVEVPGYDIISASCFIPEITELSNLKLTQKAYVDEEGRVCPNISFTFNNNPDKRQYYQVTIRYSDMGEEAELIGINDKVLLNEGLPTEALIGGGYPIGIFSNEVISETEYDMSLNFRTTGFSNNVAYFNYLVIDFKTIDYNYYEYLKQLYLFDFGINNVPLTGVAPPYPIYSNVSNGYGIFTGYSSFISDTIYRDTNY